MDDSPPGNDQFTPELKPADLHQPKRRSVRRRLVQSTLFPQTLQSQGCEENGHGKAEKNPGGDEDGDNCGSDENEDCGGSQSKRKRKPRAKSTPTKKSSEKSKGKRSRGNTPKKNLASLLDEEASVVIPDLRLEAKITAEENSRIFAGRQIHPFFSACKASKKNQEVTGSEGKQFASDRNRAKKEIDCGPIHVFEKIQDTDVPLDWKTWTFYEGTFAKTNFSLESMSSSSTKEGSVGCLSFDKLSVASHPSSVSVAGDEVFPELCPIQEECARASVKSNDVNMVCFQSVKGNEGNNVNEIDSSMHTGGLRKAEIGQESKFPEERMKSYSSCCGNQPSNSLWTNKYQPRSAMEVCGNDESVKLLSEWLQHWHGRNPQSSQDLDCGIGHVQSEDYVCSECDSDADNNDKKDSFKNVLLVTGPVGSGKSAAIYACAQEQGFKVLEVNASECRNGALVKQRFGEALESHQLKRSLANPVCSPSKHIIISSALSNGTATQESADAVVEPIHMSDGKFHNATGGSGTYYSKEVESLSQENEVKPLILFEDVDITFLEDRGFIAAIQQISETAKGPIILTSNSHDCLLPDNLDRLQICFSQPSREDLLCHVHKICTAESADIRPFLLEELLHFCEGDIRKATLHLQFWCQGSSTRKATEIQRAYGFLQFDLESGHQMLPKLLPWGFPSQLAELVDKEITDSLSTQVGNILDVIEEEDSDEQELHHTFMQTNETDDIEAKKAAMLRRNWSADEYNELRAEHVTAQELPDDSETPFSCFRRSSRKQQEAVLSSDSEYELVDNRCTTCPDRLAEIVTLVEESHSLKDLRCDMDERHYNCMETESFITVNVECKSLDVSCVPESTMVPETVISNGNYFDGEVSVCNGLDLSKTNIESGTNTPLVSQEEALGFCHEDEIEVSQNGPAEAMASGYQPMDESSCIGYRRLTKYVEKPKPLTVTELVQKSWNKLRNSRADLSEYSRSEDNHGLQVVNLAHEMSNLISETDILLSHGQNLSTDSMDPLTIPMDESDVYNLYDMCALATTTAEHGFCHYVKSIATIGSARGSVSTGDLVSEIWTSRIPSRKPAQQEIGTRSLETSMPKTDILLKSETKATLFSVLQSIVPPKSQTTLRGPAFYEYLSSLRSISRSEASRHLQGNENPRKRRRRADRHYLSTGRFMLTPEEISSLGQINTYRDVSLLQDQSS